MNVSVIIPTYNGEKKITHVLQALEQQTYREFEVVIVIDGSTDNTRKILNDYNFSFSNKVIYQQNSGRAAVRNRGAQEAKGNILIFFDDDMRPESTCIEEHVSHHESIAGSIVSGAQIDDYKNANTDFLRYKCWLSRKWAASLISFENAPLPWHHLHLTAANLSVEKKIFMALGGFDYRLNDAEDFDLAVRAAKANIPVYYRHKAFAWHDDLVTTEAYILRKREYYRAHNVLRSLKPELYTNFSLRDPESIKGLKRMFFSVFAQRFWIKMINKNALGFIPRAVRYKILDYTITAYGSVFVKRSL